MTIILLLIGLGLIVVGADWLVDGSSAIARRAGVSEFVIGLTIVGFGTSCPELVVSLTGAIEGNADISVGNVIGSNIFNVLFILGVTALLLPVGMTDKNRKRDIPITLAVTVLLLLLGMGAFLFGRVDSLSRVEGLIMLLIFAAYVFYCFKTDSHEGVEDKVQQKVPLWKAAAFVIAGLAGLIFGGDLFVDKVTLLARQLGVSDKFIAVTILAGGTSLPELATSIAAAIKGKEQMALGNILGSNVFNALFILGVASCITPLSFGSMTAVDAIALLFSAVILLVWAYTGRRNRIDRLEGAAMLVCFVAYYIFLFQRL